jgi:hypothetical protein
MNLKQLWASIFAWWTRFAARWRKPQSTPTTTPTVLEGIPEPLVLEEVAAVEPDVVIPAITIELESEAALEPEIIESAAIPEPEVPGLAEFEVAGIEAGVVLPSIPIDLEFIDPPAEQEVVAEPQPKELERAMKQFAMLLTARELRAHRHYQTTGSCNVDVPRQDSRTAAPQDCRVRRPRNSRIPPI